MNSSHPRASNQATRKEGAKAPPSQYSISLAEFYVKKTFSSLSESLFLFLQSGMFTISVQGVVALLHFLLGQRKSHYAVTDSRGHNAQDVRTNT